MQTDRGQDNVQQRGHLQQTIHNRRIRFVYDFVANVAAQQYIKF